MRKTIFSTAVILFWLMILLAGPATAGKPNPDTDRKKAPDAIYPDAILHELGITPADIVDNQSKFINDPIHVEWMHHVRDALPEISQGEKDAIADIHTAMLFIKSRLDDGYFTGKTQPPEYADRLAGLMQWFQTANLAVLTSEEHQRLFGPQAGEEATFQALSADGEIKFPIKNPNTTPEMIKTALDASTIGRLNYFYQEQSRELKDITEIYQTEDFQKAGKDQIKKDMARIERELDAAFLRYGREVLTDEAFYLVFGIRTTD